METQAKLDSISAEKAKDDSARTAKWEAGKASKQRCLYWNASSAETIKDKISTSGFFFSPGKCLNGFEVAVNDSASVCEPKTENEKHLCSPTLSIKNCGDSSLVSADTLNVSIDSGTAEKQIRRAIIAELKKQSLRLSQFP